MRKKRWLVIPFLMIFAMGCGLISEVQGLQNAATTALPALETAASTDLPAMETAASTAIPALLTSVPTAQGLIETAAAQIASSTCPSTPTAGGLGISMDTARTVLQMTQQFAFADGTVDGQPAVTVTLTPDRSLVLSGHRAGIFCPVYWGSVQFEPDFDHHPSHGPAGHRRSGRQRIEHCPHRHITPGCTVVFSYLGDAKLSGRTRVRPTADHHQDLSSLPCKGTRPAWFWISCRRNRAQR